MKLQPNVDTDVKWDDSGLLGPLTEWKDIPHGRAPVSYACDEQTWLEEWQQGRFTEDLAESMRERNSQTMSDERRYEYISQLMDKLTKRIIADGEDPKRLPELWSAFVDSPDLEIVLALVGKRLDGPHSGSRADLVVIWDRLIMSGGTLGKWMRAAGERIEGSAY
jgi:hypothetical protein